MGSLLRVPQEKTLLDPVQDWSLAGKGEMPQTLPCGFSKGLS